MIGKKVLNAKAGGSKAARIGGLLDYIRAPQRAGSDEKCAYYGALGFVTDSPGGHRAEMIALAQDAVRSADPVNHYILSWREGEVPQPAQVEEAVSIRASEKVAPLVRQLPWTHHLLILGRAKHSEEREFYMLAAIQARWTKRELERQIRSGAALCAAPGHKKVSPALTQIHPAAVAEFKNEYSLEFLGLPADHSEADLHGALLRNLGRFITELGRDFCFVGSEYPVQVGKQDFAIDLVFFHRGLACLVAFELKVPELRPEDLGKLSFYVEALDRDFRKDHERPSIGVLLCATKDNEVVEYALARTTSPTLVAEYQTVLPSKELLRQKLHELYAQLAPEEQAAATSKANSRRSRLLSNPKTRIAKGKR